MSVIMGLEETAVRKQKDGFLVLQIPFDRVQVQGVSNIETTMNGCQSICHRDLRSLQSLK
jgi:hypothetical protein